VVATLFGHTQCLVAEDHDFKVWTTNTTTISMNSDVCCKASVVRPLSFRHCSLQLGAEGCFGGTSNYPRSPSSGVSCQGRIKRKHMRTLLQDVGIPSTYIYLRRTRSFHDETFLARHKVSKLSV